MAQYSINPAELTQSAGRVNQQAEVITEGIKKVMAEVQGSRQFWTGQASGQYEALMTDWNSTATKVQQSLNNTIRALQQAAAQYDTTESQNTSRFAG